MRRFLLAAAAAVFLTACEAKITRENFEAIVDGMTKTEVDTLLGEGDELIQGGMGISSEGLAGGASKDSRRTYVYKDATSNVEISVTYDKDWKVVDKTQRGL